MKVFGLHAYNFAWRRMKGFAEFKEQIQFQEKAVIDLKAV